MVKKNGGIGKIIYYSEFANTNQDIIDSVKRFKKEVDNKLDKKYCLEYGVGFRTSYLKLKKSLHKKSIAGTQKLNQKTL